MKYRVSMAVDGRVDLEVEAESFDDAKQKAMTAFMDADFSTFECVDYHPVNAEDEGGNLHDY